jgi:hypothetical protein
MSSSQEPSRAERNERSARISHHDVIVQREAEQACAVLELPRQMYVLFRWRGVAAGVVVGDDEMGGALADGRSQNFARMDDGSGQAARGDVVMPGQAILSVEEQDDEMLAPIIRDQASRDGSGKLRGLNAIPDGGLVLADDRVTDVAKVALAPSGNPAAWPRRRARTGLGEMGFLTQKRGRHNGSLL